MQEALPGREAQLRLLRELIVDMRENEWYECRLPDNIRPPTAEEIAEDDALRERRRVYTVNRNARIQRRKVLQRKLKRYAEGAQFDLSHIQENTRFQFTDYQAFSKILQTHDLTELLRS